MAVAVLQVLVIVGATLWLTTRTEAVEPRSASTPVSWRAVVRDTGGALLNLRTTPEVGPSNASRTAAVGDQLDIVCGQTGDTVAGAPGRTGVWLKTTDQLYVSQLYVAVPGQTHVPRCPEPDLLLIEMPIQTPASAAPRPDSAQPSAGASTTPRHTPGAEGRTGRTRAADAAGAAAPRATSPSALDRSARQTSGNAERSGPSSGGHAGVPLESVNGTSSDHDTGGSSNDLGTTSDVKTQHDQGRSRHAKTVG